MIQEKDLYRGHPTRGNSGFFAQFDDVGRLVRIEFRRDGEPSPYSLEIDPNKKTGRRCTHGGGVDSYSEGLGHWSDHDPLGDGQSWKTYPMEFEEWCKKQIHQFYESVAPQKCAGCDRAPALAGQLFSDPMSLHFLCTSCARYFLSGMESAGQNNLELPETLKNTQVILRTECNGTTACHFCELALLKPYVDVARFGYSDMVHICRDCAKKSINS